MRHKKNREINVFSTSAIDLFASSMGVFILLMIITIPYYTKTETKKPVVEEKPKVEKAVEKIPDLRAKVKELEAMTQKQKTEIVKKQEIVGKQKIEIEELKKRISTPHPTAQKNFLVVIVKWTTNRHDLDLAVTTPDKLTYNFKNKSYKDKSGLFSLDSRTGPGAEVFQTPEAQVGDYQVTYNFYNSYGNDEPMKAQGTVLTTKGSFELPVANMDLKEHRSVSFKFRLTSDGEVKILK